VPRRRDPQVAPEGGVPERFWRFRASEWIYPDDPPPDLDREWPDAMAIRALRRWLDANHDWRAKYGEWPNGPASYYEVVDPPRATHPE